MTNLDRPGPQFYFALPRLLAKWRGGDPTRGENNGAEAWIGGLAVYSVSYLFFAGLIPPGLNRWQLAAILVSLAFVVWLIWLVLLYLNSLLIRMARAGGVLRGIPDRRAQSVLVGATATAMAFACVQNGDWISEIAAIWIVAVAMNLAAAAVLALTNGSRAGS